MRITALLLAIALAAAPPAAAQEMDPDAFQQRMDEASAAAARPGDEALTCDQLRAELGAAMTDPNVQASIAANGALAQQQMDMAQSARNAALAQMGVGMAMNLASAFVPGLGYAQQAMQMAQMGAMQRQSEDALAQRQEMFANMDAIMPQLMRGQRIVELAQAKQCPFLQEQELSGDEDPPSEPAG